MCEMGFSPTVWVIAISFTLLGNCVVKSEISRLRRKHKIYESIDDPNPSRDEKDYYNRSTNYLGYLELVLYFFSTYFSLYQFIGWWLVVKLAGRWSAGG